MGEQLQEVCNIEMGGEKGKKTAHIKEKRGGGALRPPPWEKKKKGTKSNGGKKEF